MKGDNHLLALTTTKDEITGETKPLFAFPVQVCKATDSGRDFSWDIAAPSGAPRKQVYRDEATGEVIEDADCKRGVRVGDSFREVPEDAREAIKARTESKTMVVEGAIARAEFMAEYGHLISGIYYLQSPTKGGSHKAYRLTYEALREVRKGRTVKEPARVLVTKRVARTKEKVCAIFADEQRGCLMMFEVAPVAAFRAPDEAVLAPQKAEVEERQIEMARTVVAGLPDGTAWLDEADDTTIAAKQELRDAVLMGEAISVPEPVAVSVEQDDLTELLMASVAATA